MPHSACAPARPQSARAASDTSGNMVSSVTCAGSVKPPQNRWMSAVMAATSVAAPKKEARRRPLESCPDRADRSTSNSSGQSLEQAIVVGGDRGLLLRRERVGGLVAAAPTARRETRESDRPVCCAARRGSDTITPDGNPDGSTEQGVGGRATGDVLGAQDQQGGADVAAAALEHRARLVRRRRRRCAAPRRPRARPRRPA